MNTQELYQEKLDAGATKPVINKWFQENGLEVPDKFAETTWTDAARAAGQGLLFGFGDELEAMARSGSLSGPEYEQQRDQIRSELQTWQNNNKGKSIALELAGGLGSGGPLVSAGKWVGKKLLAKAAPSLVTAIAGGAAEGALVGAGQAKEMSDIPTGMATGAAFGGGAGGGLSVAGDIVRGFRPQANAQNKVREGLRNAGVDPSNPQIPQGGVIADIPGMDQTFRGAAGGYGPGRQIASEAMDERLAGMPERITRAGQDIIGDTKTPMQKSKEIAELRRVRAKENYGAAMSGSVVPSDGVLSILNTKDGRSAYKGAFDDYNVWHRDNPMEFVDYKDADTITSLEFWDKARQRLGDTATKAKRAGANARHSTVTDMRSIMKDEFNKQTDGKYGYALDDFSELIRQEKAINYGRDIIKKRDMNPVDVEEYISGLSELERHEVLRGVMGELDIIAGETVEGGNAARKVMRKPATKRKIMAAFDDKQQGAQFVDTLTELSDQASLATDLLSGSRTTPMRQEIDAVSGAGGAITGGLMTSGDPTAMLGGAGIGMARNRAQQAGQQTSENIVNTLLRSDGQTISDLFKNRRNPWVDGAGAAAGGSALYNSLTE